MTTQHTWSLPHGDLVAVAARPEPQLAITDDPDTDAVDVVVDVAERLGMDPLIPLTIAIVESGGLRRRVMLRGRWREQIRTFPAGDVAPRLDGSGVGPHSFGAFQMLADVWGPWLEPAQYTTTPIWIFPPGRRIPDYLAAAETWDDIERSMTMLFKYGPNGGWQHVWMSGGGNEGFAADPVGWIVRHAPLMQGSIAWARSAVEQALTTARRALAAYRARRAPPAPPPPAPLTMRDLIDALTVYMAGHEQLAERADRIIAEAQALAAEARVRADDIRAIIARLAEQ